MTGAAFTRSRTSFLAEMSNPDGEISSSEQASEMGKRSAEAKKHRKRYIGKADIRQDIYEGKEALAQARKLCIKLLDYSLASRLELDPKKGSKKMGEKWMDSNQLKCALTMLDRFAGKPVETIKRFIGHKEYADIVADVFREFLEPDQYEMVHKRLSVRLNQIGE